MLADFEVVITDATALLTAKLIVNLPFYPRYMEAMNVTNAARPKIIWDQNIAAITGTEEGIMEKGSGATATARTCEDLTTGEGIVVADGGLTIMIKAASLTAQTYKDINGTTVVAGTVFDGDGNDWLADRIPPVAVDNQANARYDQAICSIAINANNGDIRGDAEVIVVRAWM